MKRFSVPTSVPTVFSLLSLMLFVPQPAWGQAQPSPVLPARAIVFDHPLNFEENKGQAPVDVLFLAHGDGYALSLKADEAVITLSDPARKATPAQVSFYLVDANPAAAISGVTELSGRSNYFQGNDPAQWTTGVRQYGKVQYAQVYPGIDAIYYGKQHQVEHDFVVAPQADPNQIQIDVRGGMGVRITASGDVEVGTAAGTVILRKPVLYQQVDGVRHNVTGGYEMRGKNRLGFRVGNYDHTARLIIDPSFTVNSPLGGNAFTETLAIATDSSGNIYATGFTLANNFSLKNAIQSACSGGCANSDAYITKMDPTGTTILYSTYFGGSGIDQGLSVSADASGNAYITGTTTSTNLPTKSPVQANFTGSLDAFVLKLDPNGLMVYSTYLGGSNLTDFNNGYDGAIKADSQGNAYVTGSTNSSDFPVTSGVFQGTLKGSTNAYLTKFGPTGALLFSTFLGGTGADGANGLDLDSAGDAYLVGTTTSANFPVTTGAYSTKCSACASSIAEAFVVEINPTGTKVVAGSFDGDAGGSTGTAIAVANNEVYLAGYTLSLHFPTTTGAYQTSCLSCQYNLNSGFVSAFNLSLSSLIYATYLGDLGNTQLSGIFVDAAGDATVTGYSTGPDYPITTGAPQPSGGGGFFISSDGGKTFTRSNYGFGGNNVRQVVQDAVNPAVVYAATGDGCFISQDYGATWTPFNNGLPAGANLQGIAANSSALWATVSSSPAGVYKYSFANKQWAFSSNGLPSSLSAIDAITVDPSNSNTLYLGTGGRTAEVYKSTDGGATWVAEGVGITNTNTGFENVTSISVDPTNSSNVAISIVDPFGTAPGFFKTTNGGTSWTQSNTGLNTTVINNLTRDPNNPNTLYAAEAVSFGLPSGIAKTINGGTNWNTVLDLGGFQALSVKVDPTNSNKVYAGLQNAGLAFSIDAGNSWTGSPDLSGVSCQGLLEVVNAANAGTILCATSPSAGGQDGASTAVLTQFNPAGTQLLLSTFLGGPFFSTGVSIASNSVAPLGIVAGFGEVPPAAQNFGGTATGLDSADAIQGFLIGVGTAVPSLTVTKTLNNTGPIAEGDTVFFTITVTNTSSQSQLSSIDDTLPSNFDPNSVSANSNSGINCGVNNGTVTCDAGGNGLMAGYSYTVYVRATAVTPGSFTNTVTDFGGVSASASGMVNYSFPAIILPTSVNPGNIIIGNSASTKLTFTSPGTLNYRPLSIVPTCSSNASCSTANDTCSGQTLTSGGTCSVNVITSCTSAGSLTGSLKVIDNSSASPVAVPIGGTCTPPSPDVAITKTAITAFPANPGDTVSFSITVTNKGTATALPATMHDTLPTNFDPASIMAVVTSGNAICSVGAGGVTCDANPSPGQYSLSAGSSYTILVTATALNQGAFVNNATVNQTSSDTNSTDKSASVGGQISYAAPVVLTPTSLSLPNLLVGSFSINSIRVNASALPTAGAFPTSISASSFVGATGSVVNDTCSGKKLSQGSSCTFGVQVGCTVAGPFSGAVIIVDHSSTSPASLPVSGTCVIAAPSTTSLTALPAAINVGGTVMFTTKVTSTGAGTPTGTVRFNDGATLLGTGTLDATATAILSLSTLSIGMHTISAIYGGDPNFVTSTSPSATVVVSAIPTSTAVSTSTPSSVFGTPVVFTVTVTGSGATPSGTVTFLDGTASLGAVALNASGVATLTTSALAVGGHTINAQYAGDATHGVSAGSVQQTIVAVPPDFAITANPSSITINRGGTGTSTLTVTPVGGATGNITVSCTTSAPDITCTTVPSPIVLNGSNTPVTAVLTINTLLHSELHAPFVDRVVLALSLWTPVWLFGWRRRRLKKHATALRMFTRLMLMVCTLALPLLGACAGSNSAGSSTPPGGYSLTVTAAGSTTHTVLLNVTVQ